MKSTIEIEGARENNLKNVSLAIPRDRLVVITGMSGSGKSSLAFDTVYAEGQRRLLASMSSYTKRFVDQLRKPDVDFVNGLSPVVSIDQKTVAGNPRSTVGTLTDVSDYLRMLFATLGVPHCPLCRESVPVLSTHQMTEHLLSLPAGVEVEVRAPALRIYGEDLEYLFDQIRTRGYRRARLDGEPVDLGEDIAVDEDLDHTIEVVVDRFVIGPGIDKQVTTSLGHGLEVGDGFLSFHLEAGSGAPRAVSPAMRRRFYLGFGCAAHRVVSSTLHHGQFTFNDPAGACVTCGGIGTTMRAHPTLLVPDPQRTLREGAILEEALSSDRNSWGGRLLYSLSRHFGFSLDVPFAELPPRAVDVLFRGTRGEKFEVAIPEGARRGQEHAGRQITFQGVLNQLEHNYRRYRKQGTSNAGMENYLRRVLVEYDCPDCEGARLKLARRLVEVAGKNLHQVGELHLVELAGWLRSLQPTEKARAATETIQREVGSRLDLLIGIGLDYLSLNRRSATLSGGESQRIRLSSQIGSGLMGMLYVLDEPSIGLHPKDNVKMIETLRHLRDVGNTVIVVEHDEETIRAADWVVELGPGPGVHGGEVVASGTLDAVLAEPRSPTGRFLSGARVIPVPERRRVALERGVLGIRGARHNNLANLDVDVPLGVLVCVTGASGSGKSSLVHDVLYKKLASLLHDSRILAGDCDGLEGVEHIDDVIHVDQSPIGRSPRSNPATYIGFYDNIRKLFAATDEAGARGYTASRFSFNTKGGRCEECAGEGAIVTHLSFMPDVEVTCPTCKGRRYNDETLEVAYRGRNIAEVLDLPIEEGVEFFADERTIARKLRVLDDLGLGYLEIGHPATILSGGEAQRVKLASELGKLRRGRHNLYILDEPTTGLHFADIEKLLVCLDRLVEAGHSVLVIEHNIDVIKTADWVIDLGPEGGHKGGRLLAAGTPEEVAAVEASHTGRFLRPLLARRPAPGAARTPGAKTPSRSRTARRAAS
jgi:excinuclease ABC subunit A